MNPHGSGRGVAGLTVTVMVMVMDDGTMAWWK
jgi:hypothetical protein